MKDRSTCMVDDHNCSTEYDEDMMECSDFLDLVGLTKEMENGEVNIYIMAERIANLLGQSQSLADDLSCDDDYEDEDDDDDDDRDTDSDSDAELAHGASTRVEWNATAGDHDRNLLLAGYTNCMDEAIRYLVEEEQYSCEHPVVQGLKHHLVSQQERVLVEAAARGTTTTHNNNNNNLNNQTDGGDNRLALRVDSFCTIRPTTL